MILRLCAYATASATAITWWRSSRRASMVGRSASSSLRERPATSFMSIERHAVRPAAGLVDRHDAGVLEPGGDQGLAEEAELADVVRAR